ncbi:MAG: glycosyl hydrolase family 65 protein [Verrucomicrobiota bacterium]
MFDNVADKLEKPGKLLEMQTIRLGRESRNIRTARVLGLLGCVLAYGGDFAKAAATDEIDQATLDQWSAPYRGWHYQPDHVIPADPKIPGYEKFQSTDVPCVYQLPGQPDKWFMSFIAFNGQGYNSFVAESTNLVQWTNPRLAMGFGKQGEFDFGGCVIGAYLYESYDLKAPRLLKPRDGKFWTLYGCYAKQGAYEIDPGYEGVATSADGLAWRRIKDTPILSVQDADCGVWEQHCIYQPWLLEHGGKFYNFYNAKHMPDWIEQMGLATSPDLLNWKRYEGNPVVRVRKGGYDEQFCSDGKVFRDGDHWVMFYFGVGKGHAHIMAAFSRDLQHWTAHPEPLYQAGGNPSGLDKEHAHKISLVYNPKNETFYLYYCACGSKGRGIGLITSKPVPLPAPAPTGQVLPAESFKPYVDTFNRNDRESVVNHIPNAAAWGWMAQNVPWFECPDKDLEQTYYFRWWTYRKHIKQTPDGFVVTEFLPQVSWSKKHNTINCPVGHHLYEGRWIHHPQYLDDYARFYFGKGGDPGGVTKVYSNWLTDGLYARYLVNADKSFITGLLDEFVKNHEAWGRDGAPSDAFQKSRRLDNGLYWQIDSWEGGEYSIGGTGIRPMINSYLYSDAAAISQIAELAGRKELADRYRAEAEQLRKRVQDQLWDPAAKFFKVMRHEKAPTNQYANSAAENCEPGKRVKVREIFGYVPWYFNLPEDGRGYEEAWRQLIDPQGFLAPFGPTVAERRHPNFKINDAGCQWCGASWPFATAQTLTALANLLNNYHQSVLGKKDYFDLLRVYARSHRSKSKDGLMVSWIDESLNPDTGAWIPTADDPPRGKDYNHSTYCDLVISGLVGLRPRADDIIEVNPLVPEGAWDYFCLDHVQYHGRLITVLYDRTGERYGKGKGLQVLADGRRVAGSSSLQRVKGKLP